jgi:hypothetical protein
LYKNAFAGDKMRLVIVVIVLLLLTSCDQPTTDEKEKINFQAYQIPGCITGQIRDATGDSTCFNYVFKDTLKVDLCLTANCCPDSNRFDYSNLILSDTIKFFVADTAENLCRCNCAYIVHADISNLKLDAYIFECIYYDSLYYKQEVVRTR